ncbi:MAG: eRF1 domain 2, partial [Bdellovibrionales bacterium]
MAHSVVWIDSNNAHVFDLSKTGIFETRLKRSEATHHTFNKKDHHGDPSIEHFYRDVAAKLGGTEELLILGPGLAKGHFRKYLETHYKELAKKIV